MSNIYNLRDNCLNIYKLSDNKTSLTLNVKFKCWK